MLRDYVYMKFLCMGITAIVGLGALLCYNIRHRLTKQQRKMLHTIDVEVDKGTCMHYVPVTLDLFRSVCPKYTYNFESVTVATLLLRSAMHDPIPADHLMLTPERLEMLHVLQNLGAVKFIYPTGYKTTPFGIRLYDSLAAPVENKSWGDGPHEKV